jgi:type III secretion protein R
VSNAVLLALVAIVPLVLLTLTSFVKISVVLSLLRNALGAPDAPSGLVVTGLALVLTFFVMAPIALDMSRAATSQPSQPAQPAQASDEPWRALVPADYQPQVDQLERGLGPLRAFLAKHAAAKDQATFVELAGKLGHRDVRDDELWVLAPAFVTSELRAAFTMAILIFIPFLVLDLVVALGLASLGLATTPPQAIALPLKLLLFVAVDGWRLLIDSLLRGYA